jgi:hypothetical protein
LLAVKEPTGPGVPFVVGVHLLTVPQDEVHIAVPLNAHVWYPSGTGIEFATLDVNSKNIVALKVRFTLL